MYICVFGIVDKVRLVLPQLVVKSSIPDNDLFFLCSYLQLFLELRAPEVSKKKDSFQQICYNTLNSDQIALIISSLNLPCKFAGHHHFRSLKYVSYRFVSKTAWFWLKPSILTSDIHSKF